MVNFYWFYVLCVLLHRIYITGASDETENKTYRELEGDLFNEVYSSGDWLKTQLIKNYPTYKHDNQTFPPPKGSEVTFFKGDIQAIVVDVDCYLRIKRIVRMDVEQQALTLVVEESYIWTDESLSWNASNENLSFPIYYLSLDRNKVWTPKIYAEGALDEKDLFVSPVIAWYDGFTWMKRISQYSIPCAVNVQNFPFDVHNCSVQLKSATDGITR